jgi:hypothetical protein
MNDPGHGTGVTRATDGDLDLGALSCDAVESPERGGGHVGGDGAIARRKDCTKDALLARRRVRRVAHDTAAHRDEQALRQQRPPLLAGHAQLPELSGREEAERPWGPLGDGPVNAVSCPLTIRVG